MKNILPPQLAKNFIKADKNIDKWISKNLIGKEVTWKYTKYRGRKARILSVSWRIDSWSDKTTRVSVNLFVETRTADGKNFRARDAFHRRGFSPETFEF